MANVVRWTLSSARNLYVKGAGQFVAGVLDVDANKVEQVARTRYLVQPYHAVEVGIVPAGTAAPSLPAVPAAPAPDPYPQYVTDADLANPASGPSVALRATFATPPSWSSLASPFVIAHRGGSLQVPEETMEGYRIAIGQGVPVIEMDVQQLADGGLGVMHDGTVDRMTTSTGNVASHTSVSWKQLSVDSSAILGGGWVDGQRPALFGEVLSEFGNRILICPESKSLGAMTPMIDALERRGISKRTVLLQSFSLGECQTAVARGWPVMWLDSVDATTAAANGIPWLGTDISTVTAGQVTAAHAAGLKVAVYTATRQYQSLAAIAAGVDAVFSDDPVYHGPDAKYARTNDLFARGVYLPGQQANNLDRGKFYAGDNSWGWDITDGVARFSLHGYLKPANTSSYTLTFQGRFDAVTAADRWFSIFLGKNDYPFYDAGVTGIDGYHLLVRQSGLMGIYRVTNGVAALQVQKATGGTPFGLGSYVPISVTVGAGGITLARTDIPADTITAPDTTHRPLRYINFGRSGAGIRIKGVNVA